MSTLVASSGLSRQIGPLRFDVTAPAGWQVERDPDPLAQPFLDETGPAEHVLPVRLDVVSADARPDSSENEADADWTLALATTGWKLETNGAGGARWTLPERDGSFLWRATVTSGEARITAGPRLVDPDRRLVSTPLRYPLDQLLSIHTLAPLDGMVVHSAGWALDGRAILVAGVSGAGKTTVSHLMRAADDELLGLSDDRILVARPPGTPHSGEEVWRAWGTPWAGEGLVASSDCADLAGIVLLEHAGQETLDLLPKDEALRRILPTVSVPWYDPERAAQVLETLGSLLGNVPAYLLRFRPNHKAATLLVGLLRR